MCFFFNDPATTEIYTLSLHDALPICPAVLAAPVRLGDHAGREHDHPDARRLRPAAEPGPHDARSAPRGRRPDADRKSTRLNSSHITISYAVFCLKKKKTQETNIKHCH